MAVDKRSKIVHFEVTLASQAFRLKVFFFFQLSQPLYVFRSHFSQPSGCQLNRPIDGLAGLDVIASL